MCPAPPLPSSLGTSSVSCSVREDAMPEIVLHSQLTVVKNELLLIEFQGKFETSEGVLLAGLEAGRLCLSTVHWTH